jgi:hypothetical protein
LFVWGASVTISDAEGPHVFKTGKFRSNETPATYEENAAWIVATLTDATLSFDVREPQVRLYSDSLSSTVTGTLRVDDATGRFQSGGKEYAPDRAALSLPGTLSLTLAPAPSAGPSAPVLSSPPRISVGLGGDLTGLPNIQGVPLGGLGGLGLGAGTVVVAASAASVAAVGVGIWAGWIPAPWRALPLIAGTVVAYRSRLLLPGLSRRAERDPHAASLRVLEAERAAIRWDAKERWYSPWVALFYAVRALREAPLEERARCRETCAHYLLRIGWPAKAAAYLGGLWSDHAAWELARAKARLARGPRRAPSTAQAIDALDRAIRQDRHYLRRALGDPAFARLRRTREFAALVERYAEAPASAVPA